MSRQERVTEAIRKEASLILHDKLKDPRMGFVTVTSVSLASDLRNATVFYSVLGNEEAHKRTWEAIESGLGFIRKLICQRINLKFAPEIIFREDRSSEYSVRIEEVLNEIKKSSLPAAEAKKEDAKEDIEERKEVTIEPKKSRRLHKKI